MTDKLAGLVLPDDTPVEALPEEPAPGKRKREGFFRRRKAARGKRSSGDWLVAGCGIGLAVICALFPWYIFLNQDEFGIRPLKFSGRPGAFGSADPAGLPGLVGERIPMLAEDLQQLDFIPTGTVPGLAPFDEEALADQPFPGDKLTFRLIDAGNGRAMIEDEDGFWIVSRGSPLPDGSQVSQILERDGVWVLVTSEDAEISLSR